MATKKAAGKKKTAKKSAPKSAEKAGSRLMLKKPAKAGKSSKTDPSKRYPNRKRDPHLKRRHDPHLKVMTDVAPDPHLKRPD